VASEAPGMSRVQLYISAQSFLYRYPNLKNWVRNSYLFRTVVPLLFDFSGSFNDRQYMTEKILPALASSQARRILFVGCKAYTARYGKRLTHAGIEYWTTDIAPAAAIWGEKDHHIVCDIAKIGDLFPPESFDVVLFNGVIGDGVDKEDDMNRAITAIAWILRPNGTLLIGWNSLKKHPDPMELEAVAAYFRHECVFSLPVRKTFPDTDHVYDWLVKTKAAQPEVTTQIVSLGVARG
jgi:SAM-dependent methyltransferase